MTELDEIVVDLRQLTLGDFAMLDNWAFGKISFGDVLPIMQKAITNGVILSDQPMAQIRTVTEAFRDSIRKLPGN